MQLNWKLIQFYSTNSINVTIGLLLYLYDISLILSLVLLIMNGIILLISMMIIQKRKLIPKKYFRWFMSIILSVHISYCCFLDRDFTRTAYILLKTQEMIMVKKQTKTKSLILHLLYNILFIALFIIHKENLILYIITVYCTIQMLKLKSCSFMEQNQDLELPQQMTKPTQRNSEIINLIQDSISNSWLIRLQNIPVGIMIVKKDNLQIMFQNQSLLQMFNGIRDIPKFLMNELQFKLQIKRKRKQMKETSIKLPKKSPIQQQSSAPQFFSCNKMLSNQKLPNTLNEILLELQNGNLDQFYSKENNLELLAQLSKTKQVSFHEEEYTRNIQCKIFCGQNDHEYLIIMDDISLQSYLQKLETREKFQVRIIDSFSHELRTPLNSAKLFLDGLINDPSIDENHKCNFIYPAINALKLQAYLIRDIIDFTQFHSHVIKYKFEEFNFEDIVEEVNDIFRPILKMKNLGLHLNVKNSVPLLIYSDFDRIMQILVNLISNSIKFSERGLITLEISCYENTLTFCVKDQGVGIKIDQLHKIQEFLKSFNLNRDFSCHDEWQGLGLLVSQMNLFKLAPLNKTQLKINSNGIGEGTQIFFKIRTTQSSNTQILGGTIKRQSLRVAYTVPDLCLGIQGLLIINNPKCNNIIVDKQIQQIPIRHHSSIANYFRPQQSTGLLNQYVQQETDLLQDEITLKGNLQDNLLKLNTTSKPFSIFINNKDSKEKQIKRRKKSSFSISELDIASNKKPNTLISRLIQREEQEIEMEEKFENLQFPCQCARILSVDDDLFNQKALQVIIRQMGFRLLIAYNGIQAVELIQNTEKCSEQCKLFYFILMDCQMPIMDGWTTTKVLMDLIRDKIMPDIPIIGLTAFNSTQDMNKCLEVGMRDVLTKPLNINQLKQVLIKLFN